MTDDKMLARIAALLRQAEGTDNGHEAEAFMSAAQRLATATSIDLAVARSHADKRTPRSGAGARARSPSAPPAARDCGPMCSCFVLIRIRQRHPL